jgi:hypothetical protein
MHGGVLHHIVRQIARRILPTPILYRVANQIKVLLEIDIEGRHGPVTLGLLRLLLHAQHSHIVIELHHSRALELLDRGLLMAHDARGALLLGEINELAKAKEQKVVSRYNQ